jgi:hypothetical protein
MPPKPIAFLTYHEISQRKSSPDEFRRNLSLFSLKHVLIACSAINTLLESWKVRTDGKSHELLIRQAFSKDLADQILSLDRPVFHRQQLLFTAREATQTCSDMGRTTEGAYWGGFGLVLLKANDLLDLPFRSSSSQDSELLEIVLRFMPCVEASHFHPFQTKMMRSYLMLSKFAESMRGWKGFVDISKLFENATGVPLLVYGALIFASMARFANLSREQILQNPSLFALHRSWFDSTSVPKLQIDAFLRDVSSTADEFRQRSADPSSGLSDFTLLKDRPFYRDGDYLYPIDFSFIAEKFESGPFWRANSQMQPNERERLHSFWGTVFENYVNWLISTSASPQIHRFYPSPTYGDAQKMQVCDGIIVSNGAAILMEYKGNTFSSKSKYGGDAELLRKAIEEKLVGTEKRPKGVRQLINAIDMLFSRDSSTKLDGIDFSKVDRIIPLLIVRDDVGGTFGLNAYLNLRFQSLLGRGRRQIRKAVTPLFCFAADDLEKISAYLPDTSLTDILEGRYKAERNLRATFFAVDNPVIMARGNRRPQTHIDANEEFKSIMFKLLGIGPNAESAKAQAGGGALGT